MPSSRSYKFLQPIGRTILPRMHPDHATRRYWNAGVRHAFFNRLPLKRVRPGMQNYYNAGVYAAYGNLDEARLQLGDLFNDIMRTVVPGWDQRPQALKNIVIKPDPAKLVENAQRYAPGAAGRIVGAANQAGFNLYANTPGGQMEIDPTMAQSAYANYPLFARTQAALGSIPIWVWVAGAAGVGLLFVMSRK